jgi:hypothetical protein
MKHVLLAALLGCAIFTSADSTETLTLSGVVRDPMGAAIGGATIMVHWNMPRANGPSKPGVSDSVVETDRIGEFSIKLVPGFYDVCVHAVGFSPTCDTVALGKVQSSQYKTVLQPNPLITKEYGDHFGHEMVVNPVSTEPSEIPKTIPNPK